MPGVNGTAITARAGFGFETKMRRREIVPDIAPGFVAQIFGLDQRRLVAARDAVTTENVVALDRVRLVVLADHHAVKFRHWRQSLVRVSLVIVARAHHSAAVWIEF